MAKYMHDDATRKEVAYNEILTFYFGEIARREVFGDFEGTYRAIESLEKSMAYLIDNQYKKDIKEIAKLKQRPGKTVAQIKNNEHNYRREAMDMKHIALVNLAYRTGKLGHKVMPKSTQMDEMGEEEYEQILS